MAALTALAAQERSAAGKAPLGNIDPLLYANSSWFSDVAPSCRAPPPAAHLVNNQRWHFNGDGSRDPGPRPRMAHASVATT